MKTSKLVLVSAVIASIFSCSSDDNNRSIAPPVAPPVAPPSGSVLNGAIAEDRILSADVEYSLTGPLTIQDGATLTIEPGTIIRARSGRTDVFIAVERGGKLMAEGTATDPIIFTSDALTPRAGDWGGIVLAGKAPSNKGTNVQSEVAGLLYGGTETGDNSGILRYVIAQFTGAKINGEQEFNGISFFGVGSGTIVENIVVSNGADDGVEFFGGNVNVTNVFCSDIADDMFDWTEGYSGTIDNGFGVLNDGFNSFTSSQNGIEGDSNSNDNAAVPVSRPTLNNITILNLNTLTTEFEVGAVIRRGTEATFNNVLFAAAPGAAFDNRIRTSNSDGGGTVTLVDAREQGNVGADLIGGAITGTFETVTDGITIDGDANTVTSVTGIGADLTVFAWANPTFRVGAVPAP